MILIDLFGTGMLLFFVCVVSISSTYVVLFNLIMGRVISYRLTDKKLEKLALGVVTVSIYYDRIDRVEDVTWTEFLKFSSVQHMSRFSMKALVLVLNGTFFRRQIITPRDPVMFKKLLMAKIDKDQNNNAMLSGTTSQ